MDLGHLIMSLGENHILLRHTGWEMINNAGIELFAVEIRAFGEGDIVVFDRSSNHRTQFHRCDSPSCTVIGAYAMLESAIPSRVWLDLNLVDAPNENGKNPARFKINSGRVVHRSGINSSGSTKFRLSVNAPD